MIIEQKDISQPILARPSQSSDGYIIDFKAAIRASVVHDELVAALDDAVANYIAVVANTAGDDIDEIKADPVVAGWLKVLAKARGGLYD